ncbi:MAG: hypothetical protein M1825_004996 [Sarcosagium campestre]|nr:MAG: hypothetical protein M1825_004996 [Sarcosagium campestre]
MQPPSKEDIATYFSLIHPLKYSQTHQPLGSPFSPPLNGLSITAYNAGHTLGGTLWHIQHGLESIVYSVDWNQARENVLSGAAWLGVAGLGGAEVVDQLRKPTALVCSSRGAAQNAASGGRKKRDELLLDMIRSSVAKGGTVLIPTDSSSRVLELAYLLERAWRVESEDSEAGGVLRSSKLYLASKNIGATMRYARSMLEWMDESVIREFESEATGQSRSHNRDRQDKTADGRTGAQSSSRAMGPFDFKYLQLLERRSQVERILTEKVEHGGKDTGKVILASDTTLGWGFSREVLGRIAGDSRNLIILTENLADDDGGPSYHASSSLGGTLFGWWQERRDGVATERASDGGILELVYGGGREISVPKAQKVALESNDLLVYQRYLATQRQLQGTLQNGDQAALTSAVDAVDDASSTSSSSSDDSDSEQQGKALNISTALAHSTRNKLDLSNEDLGVNVLLRRKGVYDFDVRAKKGREKMFPFVLKRRRADEFGDVIRPEEYLKAEEREEDEDRALKVSGVAGRNAQGALGQKRKWEDLGSASKNGGRRFSAGKAKRRRSSLEENGAFLRGNAASVAQDLVSEEQGASDSSDDEAVALTSAAPSKVVYSADNIQVNLKIAFVDFAGRHDKRSLHMLIPLIRPRKLILIAGRKEETLALAADCRRLLGSDEIDDRSSKVHVFTPTVGTSVNASVDTNAWQLRLAEPLVKTLHWQSVRGLGVVHVAGLLTGDSPAEEAAEQESAAQKGQKRKAEPNLEVERTTGIHQGHASSIVVPTLKVIPTSLAAGTRSVAQPLHVGDLRLADLRKLLQGSGHTAEFRGEGTLLIDGLVAVRKTATGRIEIEGGALSMASNQIRSGGAESSFLAIKRKIYEGLAVVASG